MQFFNSDVTNYNILLIIGPIFSRVNFKTNLLNEEDRINEYVS